MKSDYTIRPKAKVTSIVFKNRVNEAVTVVVGYKRIPKGLKSTEVIVPASGSATVEERTVTVGPATLVLEIGNIKVKSPAPARGGAAKLKAPFPGAEGAAKQYQVDIVNSNTCLRFSTTGA
ncbi:hypothetical protein NESM_000471000 [Novymonas esmeraldas]|uniref:Uncharacterized protein n=1 Tax=Novymonas esmeraldas TaxID=1808958 RepID=A0AAW0ERL0_9TRYP